MNIELDGIPLVKADTSPQGEQVEVRNIFNISTTDKRDMIGHKIPGMEGDVFQNLGRSPVIISFDGDFQGKTAKENLEVFRAKFKTGTPLPFNSDLSGAADITQVLINDMRIEESATVIGKYHYFMVLQEYKVPPPEPVMPPAQDEEAAQWQKEKTEEQVESINVITGKVLDAEGKPKAGVRVKATGKSEIEYGGDTDEEGMYRIEEVDPGTYTVTVASEEYEGIEEEVTVGGGESKKESGEETGEREEGGEEGTEKSSEPSGKGKESSGEEKSAGKSEDIGSAESKDTEANGKDNDEGESEDTGRAESKDTEANGKDNDEGVSEDTGRAELKDTEANGKDEDAEKSKDTDKTKSKSKQSPRKK